LRTNITKLIEYNVLVALLETNLNHKVEVPNILGSDGSGYTQAGGGSPPAVNGALYTTVENPCATTTLFCAPVKAGTIDRGAVGNVRNTAGTSTSYPAPFRLQ
jgi:hypothetical protein